MLSGCPLPEVNVILFLFLSHKCNRKSDITLCPLHPLPTVRVKALSQVSISGIWPIDTLFLFAAQYKHGGLLYIKTFILPPCKLIDFLLLTTAKRTIRAVN